MFPVGSSVEHANAGTQIVMASAEGQSHLSRFDAVTAAGSALEVARRNTIHGTVLVVLDRSGAVVRSDLLMPGDALTLGRHTEARLRLPGKHVALRQLLIHLSSDGARLFLWDLGTEQGIYLSDLGMVRAVVGEGPGLAGIAGFTLLWVPASCFAYLGGSAEEFWERVGPAHLTDVRTQDATLAPRIAVRSLDVPMHPRGTHVTVTREPSELRVGGDRATAWAELVIKTDGANAVAYLSAEDLARGILIGRYPRCQLEIPGFDRLSRIHLFLVHTGDCVRAFDTASLNGTRFQGVESTHAILGKEAIIHLAGQVQLKWKRLAPE